MERVFQGWEAWAWALGMTTAVVVGALLLHGLFYWGYALLGTRRPRLLVLDGSLLRHSRRPMRLLLPILGLYLFSPLILKQISEGNSSVLDVIRNVLYVLLIFAVSWLLIQLTAVVNEVVARRYSVDVADNLASRKVRTQVGLIRRILIVIIIVFGLTATLLHFEGFREIGTGLLASAGVVGIIIGFAAQRTLGNLLAGFQIAITQPIRVDDVVVVEGEWGRIEEITLTYVIVRIWDLRRLVLPISYFIEKPFQNWTRSSAAILGTVFLHMDYTVPIDRVRAALVKALHESEYWDREVWRLHVTDTTENTVELRGLMSAANSSDAFELRAEVREKLITFLQREYPEALPRLRAEVATFTAHEKVPTDEENVAQE